VTFDFTAALWMHHGEAAWYFVTLPEPIADEIADLPVANRRGFGSVRVEVTVGSTTWRTSIFPDTKAASYVLPVKKAVRVSERLDDGSELEVSLTVVDQ